MRSQAVIISAMMASVILIFALVVFYVPIFSRLGSYYEQSVGITVRDIMKERPIWGSRELGEAIASRAGARYVKVNITVLDALTGRRIDELGGVYVRTPIDTPLEELYVRKYFFTKVIRDMLIYQYEIEVGT